MLSSTYLINEVDESLGFLSPKVFRVRDPAWGMYQGPNIRDGLGHGCICSTGANGEDRGW